jgi:hypothetical protein
MGLHKQLRRLLHLSISRYCLKLLPQSSSEQSLLVHDIDFKMWKEGFHIFYLLIDEKGRFIGRI